MQRSQIWTLQVHISTCYGLLWWWVKEDIYFSCSFVILIFLIKYNSLSNSTFWIAYSFSTKKLCNYHCHQFSSVAQSCPTLCNPMNRSTPGLPVHHQLPEFTQTHIHRVSDAIQPSHPQSSPSLSKTSLNIDWLYMSKIVQLASTIRTVFWTLWERERVGWFGRMALKHV